MYKYLMEIIGKMKEITESTANELADLLEAFADDGKTLESFSERMEDMMALVVETVVRESTLRFLDCMERYASSTFITRWYWRRKVKRSVEAFHRIASLKEEIFGCAVNNA